jgi:hypothetical protein
MWEVSPEPKCRVRCYIERSEIDRMFDNRVEKAKGYLAMVDEYLERRKSKNGYYPVQKRHINILNGY